MHLRSAVKFYRTAEVEYLLDGSTMKALHIKTFFIWSAFLNWPPVLIWLPDPVRALCFLPFLFWINIPALWLGLAKLFGMPHYDIQEFGAMPKTTFAWILIVVFWLLVAALLSAATVYFRPLLRRQRRQ